MKPIPVLDGEPTTIPALIPKLADPEHYDLSAMRLLLKPIPPFCPAKNKVPAQPPDGTILKFAKKRSGYNFVAVRRGGAWETTATADWGSINQHMSWNDLVSRVRKFDVATDWAAVGDRRDPRLRDHLAVIRFWIKGCFLAAINVDGSGSGEGEWYTTMTKGGQDNSPFGGNTDLSKIAHRGQNIQVVTAWAQLI